MQFILRSLILLSVMIANSHADEVKPAVQSLSETGKENSKPSAVEGKSADEVKPAVKSLSETNKESTKVSANKTKVPVNPLSEMSMGSAKAPVVMLDYSSLTCGHCAHFHTDVLPKIEEKYIKPGYVRIIFRDYPGDQVSIKAHQVAWCKGEIKYLDFVKILYTTQEKWLLAADPIAALKSIALQNGITAEQFEACLKNQELMDKIIQVRLEGQKKYNITATPTIVINAKIYPRALSFEEFEKIVRPLLASTMKKDKKSSLKNENEPALGESKESTLESAKEAFLEKVKEPSLKKVNDNKS